MLFIEDIGFCVVIFYFFEIFRKFFFWNKKIKTENFKKIKNKYNKIKTKKIKINTKNKNLKLKNLKNLRKIKIKIKIKNFLFFIFFPCLFLCP